MLTHTRTSFFPASAVCLCLALGAAACLAGCGGQGAKPTFDGWQDSLERRVETVGNGDISVLAMSDNTSPRIEHRVIGSESPGKKDDVNGVLLGRRQVAGRDWYVFIVGKVEEGTVSDIRVAAAAASAGSGLQWTMGQQNAAATNAYRDARQRFRLQGSAAAIAFPLEEDVFEIQTSDRSITVTERQTKAQWTAALEAG